MLQLAYAWADCFKNNKTLMHCDISHNMLQYLEMSIIGDGLEYNHTLLGLHVKGNDAYVDS